MNEVTQADRDAVADYFESIDDDGSTYGAYRRGQEDNHPIVQSYAAHRIAAEKETARRIVEWLRGDVNTIHCDPQFDIGLNLADAIERGDHKETKNG